MPDNFLDLDPATVNVGVVLKMPAPALVELSAFCGADFVIIDTEHGAGGSHQLEQHIRAADSAAVPVLVRVPENNVVYIQTALDAGAAGVVVPHLASAEDARRAVSAAHYPPRGQRGLALTTRAGRQGTVDLETHLQTMSDRVIVIGQVEDMAGVGSIDDIVGVDGLSGIWIGANDLAMSLRTLTAEAAAETMSRALDSICAAVRASPKHLAMLAANSTQAQHWLDHGATLLLVTGHDLYKSALTKYVSETSSLTAATAIDVRP